MTKVLSHITRKCLTCNWSGEPQDIYCSVDKTHKTEQMFAFYDSEARKYSYSKSPSKCD